MPSSRRKTARGGALLAVLWLTAALSAIAFSVAVGIRGEIARTDTLREGTKAYYLASGAVERAILHMLWQGIRYPDGTPRYWVEGFPFLRMTFPTGEAIVEIIPESSKLNVNGLTVNDLSRLLLVMGLPPDAAQRLTLAIIDWRSGAPPGGSPFDRFYLSMVPSFRAPHASLEQIEELLLVQGVTPDLFYGRYEAGPEGQLIRRAGLRDVLTTYPAATGLDVNTAEPEVMATVGVPPVAIQMIENLRRQRPILRPQMQNLGELLGPANGRVVVGGGPVYTLRATARLARQDGTLSDVQRSVAATIYLRPDKEVEPYQILRWYGAVSSERLKFPAWSR